MRRAKLFNSVYFWEWDWQSEGLQKHFFPRTFCKCKKWWQEKVLKVLKYFQVNTITCLERPYPYPRRVNGKGSRWENTVIFISLCAPVNYGGWTSNPLALYYRGNGQLFRAAVKWLNDLLVHCRAASHLSWDYLTSIWVCFNIKENKIFQNFKMGYIYKVSWDIGERFSLPLMSKDS